MSRWNLNPDELNFKEMSESQLRGYIKRNGIDSSSPEKVVRMANKMVKEKFEQMTNYPLIETAQGIIHFQYNEKENTIEMGTVTNTGFCPHQRVDYDHSFSLDENLQEAAEKAFEIYGYPEEEEELENERPRGICR